MRTSRRLVPQLSYVLVLIASIVAWLPLMVASQTSAIAEMAPVLDQHSEMMPFSGDIAADARSTPQQMFAPSFAPLCNAQPGQWAQTITAGMTARLSAVELQLLRRSDTITAPVTVEVRAVDDAGQPTQTVLGHGSTTTVIPAHPSQPGWLTVPLDAPIELLRGQKVAIFPTSAPSACGDCYEWPSTGLDRYSGGSLAVSHDLGASFTLEGGPDAAFRTWMR